MINKKEASAIIISTIVIAFAISLLNWKIFLYSALAVFLVILVNITAKKITGFFYESKVEVSLWEFARYGFNRDAHWKKPFPAGGVFPLISKIILFPFNSFVWMASLTFDVKSKVYRAAKRHGMYSFSEMTESNIATIAAVGILVNLLFAIVGYLLGFGMFAKLNIFFAFWNMIPLSDLDGNKMFMGNIILWSFVAILTLIGMSYAVFLI